MLKPWGSMAEGEAGVSERTLGFGLVPLGSQGRAATEWGHQRRARISGELRSQELVSHALGFAVHLRHLVERLGEQTSGW